MKASKNLTARIRLLKETVNTLTMYRDNGCKIPKDKYYDACRQLAQARMLYRKELLKAPLEELLK